MAFGRLCDIKKGKDIIVFKNLIRGDVPRDNLTKNAICHEFHRFFSEFCYNYIIAFYVKKSIESVYDIKN